MELSFTAKLKNGFNTLMDRVRGLPYDKRGPIQSQNPARAVIRRRGKKTIVNAIYNRIAMDVASVDIKHVRLDKKGRYVEDIEDGLNNCLTLEANIDQTARAFIYDLVISMFDDGYVAVVPVDTEYDPSTRSSVDIYTMRTARILNWAPTTVTVEVYNDRSGNREQHTFNKTDIAIIENPMYSVMNEPNSTLQRLIEKLAILDVIDNQSGSGKLDLIIQLPYTVRSKTHKEQAEQRKTDLESQLSNSKYGVAYIDGTERVTQLNRPIENNLLKQVEYLTDMLYSQLGITQEILSGNADANAMTNYQSRIVESVLLAITDEFKRKFLSKTARSQGHTIKFYNNPFRLVPLTELANVADVMIRNRILAANDIRDVLGFKPSDDPTAEELVNPNISQPGETAGKQPGLSYESKSGDESAASSPMLKDYFEESQNE